LDGAEEEILLAVVDGDGAGRRPLGRSLHVGDVERVDEVARDDRIRDRRVAQIRGQPATPATIEPAAAPPHDESAEIARFRQSVDYLNSRAISVAGVDLFTDVESAGGGVVQVAATAAWSTIPPAGQQSYANTLLDRWAAAQGYGGPVSVQIVAPDGHVLMESSKP
jgi:hypothetical protein